MKSSQGSLAIEGADESSRHIEIAKNLVPAIDRSLKKCQVLIFASNRKVARELYETISSFSEFQGIIVQNSLGRGDMAPKLRQIKNGIHILISSMSHLFGLIRKHHLDVSTVNTLVFENAREVFLKDVDRTGVDFPDNVRLVVSFDHFKGPKNSLLDQASKLLEKSPPFPERPQQKSREKSPKITENTQIPGKPSKASEKSTKSTQKATKNSESATNPEKPTQLPKKPSPPSGIQVFVAPETYPERILKKSRVEIIEQWVVKQIIAVDSETKPVFLGRKYDKSTGRLLVTCADEYTKSWLMTLLNGASLWEGTSLKVAEI